MAKFALPMKDGVAVSKMAELREHFDLKEAIRYLGNGRLMKWLRDRGYDEEADKLDTLIDECKGNHLELAQRLCTILDVEFDETKFNADELERLTELSQKAEKLGQYTSDNAILTSADRCAFDQADLDKLAKDSKPEIYLCNGEFKIPLKAKGKHYHGFGNAVAVIPSDEYVNFEELGIRFDEVHKIKFDEKYEQVLDKHKQVEEQKQQEREIVERAEEYFHKAEDAEDAETALEYFKKAAELGHIKSMTQVGCFYYHGEDVEQDYKEALHWFKRAEEKNEPEALFHLGNMFLKGEGVEASEKQAFSNFKTAVEVSRGKTDYEDVCRVCLWYLGNMYRVGDGTDVDETKAFECMRESAKLGDADAMVDVGVMYEKGEGVSADPLAARGWYTKASKAGNPSGTFHLGYWYEINEKEYEKAAEYYRKAAQNDDADALLCLGLLYKEGKVEKTGQSAQELIEKAAKLGNDEAMILVGRWWSSGQDAREWFQKAAEQGNTEAMRRLGLSYEGWGDAPQNYIEAAKWYKKAVEGGDIESMNRLGVLYGFGNGVEKDETLARKLFLDAATAGNPDAMTNIGILFEKGIGGEKDMIEAVKWYEKAADAGDPDGMACLGNYYYNDGKYSEAEHWYEQAAKGGNGYAASRLSAMYENGNGVAKDEDSAEFWRKKAKKLGQKDTENEQEEGLSTTTKVLAGAAAVGALAVAPVATVTLGIGAALHHFFGSKDK